MEFNIGLGKLQWSMNYQKKKKRNKHKFYFSKANAKSLKIDVVFYNCFCFTILDRPSSKIARFIS